MQFQSDILQCEISLPKYVETTALGAGYMAGLGVNFWKSKADIEQNHTIQKKYYPMMPQSEVDCLYEGWLQAVNATRAFKPKKKCEC